MRVGPINAQARDVLELLTDPERCQVVLVTLPEETPVNELVETAYSLEDEVGVSLGPVVVNGLYPELAGPRRRPGQAAAEAAGVACARARPRRWPTRPRSAAHAWRCRPSRSTASAELLPLPQLSPARTCSTPTSGPAEVDVLADRLLDGIGGLPELASPA